MKRNSFKATIIKILLLTMLIIVISALKLVSSYAGTEALELIDVSISNQTENTNVNSISFDQNTIQNDISFNKLGESVTYKIRILNNSDEDYKVQSISHNNENEYIKFEIADYSGAIIKSGEEFEFEIKVTYANEITSESEKLQKFATNFVIDYENQNGENIEQTILINSGNNPKTGDNIDIYIITMVCSFIAIIAIICKNITSDNKYAKSAVRHFSLFIIVTIIMPCIANAESDNYDIVIDNTYRLSINGGSITDVDEENSATFDTGYNVREKMLSLAGDEQTDINAIDYNIRAIKMSETEPTEENKEEKNIVSTETSTVPIYMWFEDGTIYWWSLDKTPALNDFSRAMLADLRSLTDISGLKDFDVSKTTSLRVFLSCCTSLESIEDLKKWNVSNVKDLTGFCQCTLSLTSLDGLEDWDVSNVEYMDSIFAGHSSVGTNPLTDISALKKWDTRSLRSVEALFSQCIDLKTLDGIEEWDLSNATDIRNLFYNCNALESVNAIYNWNTSSAEDMQCLFWGCKKLTELDLRNFNTENVTNFYNMFDGCTELEKLDLTSFNSGNVTNMRCMFIDCFKLAEIDLSSFNTENVETMARMFESCKSLKTIDLSSFDMTNVTDTSNMLKNCNALTKIITPKAYPSKEGVTIKLPFELFDSDNNGYTELDKTSPTETELIKL